MCVSSLNIYHPIQVTSTSLLQPMTTGHLVQSQSGMSWELNELPWFLLGWFSMFGNAFGLLPPNASWKILDSRLESLSFKHFFFEKKKQPKEKTKKVTTESWLVSPKIHRISYCVFWQPPIRPYGEWQNSPTWLPQEHSISMMMSINSIWEINSSSKKLPLGIVFLRGWETVNSTPIYISVVVDSSSVGLACLCYSANTLPWQPFVLEVLYIITATSKIRTRIRRHPK